VKSLFNNPVFVLGIGLVACGEWYPGPVTPDPPDNDPTFQPTPEEATDDFERTCGKLRELGCKEGRNTPEGNTCETVLRNAAAEGIDLVGDVECTMQATSCEAARKCE
jgi:hypothetical protein